jgi:hypothetical protein
MYTDTQNTHIIHWLHFESSMRLMRSNATRMMLLTIPTHLAAPVQRAIWSTIPHAQFTPLNLRGPAVKAAHAAAQKVFSVRNTQTYAAVQTEPNNYVDVSKAGLQRKVCLS